MQQLPLILLAASIAVTAPLRTLETPVAAAARSAAVSTLQQQHVVRHLNGALALLERRDVSALTDAQRANRAAAIALLTVYRDAGAFPINRDFDTYTPYFVDPVTGVRCAVGELMARTGHEAMVQRIATFDNHVRVLDLAGDAEVRAWLETYGLTLEEAARIQPMYGPVELPPEPPAPNVTDTQLHSTLGVTSVLSLAQVVSLTRPMPRVVSGLGVVAGLAGVVTAMVADDRDGARLATGLTGMASAALGARRLWPPDRPKASVAASEERLRWSVSPTLDARRMQFTLGWRF